MLVVLSLLVASFVGVISPTSAFATPSSTNLQSWGYNYYGYLGNGSSSDSHSPGSVSGQKYVVQVSTGNSGVLALHNDGTVTAWGPNSEGQLGDGGTSTHELSPVSTQLPPVVQVSSGGNDFGLAIDGSGNVYSFGRNNEAELGRTIGGNYDPSPGVVGAITSPITAISAGETHSLALASDGHVWAWGANSAGQLGDPSRTASTYSPFQIPNLSNVTSVSAEGKDSYALDSSGDVWVWGWDYTTTPTQQSGLSSITAVSAGYNSALALDSGGHVWAWGSNQYGAVGDGGSTGWRSPVQLTTVSSVTYIEATYGGSFAVESDGTLWGWGGNWFGQLGDGTTTQANTPEHLTGVGDVVGVSSNGGATISWGQLPTSTATLGTPTGAVASKLYTMDVTVGSISGVTCPSSVVVTIGDSLTRSKPLCSTGGSAPSSTTVNASVLSLDPETSYSIKAFIDDAAGVTSTHTGSLTTPKVPVFVPVGTSYSSGHNQSTSQPCSLIPTNNTCGGEAAATTLTKKDVDFAWPKRARDQLMSELAVPSRWNMVVVNAAESGAKAADFASAGPSTSGCPGCGELDAMVNALDAHAGSWNLVSVEGGPNDAGLATTLHDYYASTQGAGEPWDVADRSTCPDTDNLANEEVTYHDDVIDALTGVINAAHTEDSNVRTVGLAYPHLLATGNGVCGGEDSMTAPHHGANYVIDQMDSAITGLSSVHDTTIVDLRSAGAYATDPLSLTQQTVYYGFPYPNASGQTQIATSFVDALLS